MLHAANYTAMLLTKLLLTLQGALNKLRLGLSEADVSSLLTKVGHIAN